jgi:hypothetical protein
MALVNIHWRNNQTQAKDIMYGWFQRTHISQKYYKEYPTTASHQVGGVLQVATGDITSRVSSQGGDKLGQGRWTWHTLSGKAQRTVHIITAYRLVKNTDNAGSVWHQQQYYANCNNLQGLPHERWIQDLKTELQTWMAHGDSIILMADFNEDVRTGKTVDSLKQLGLVDNIVASHASTTPTFTRGSTTINTILASQEIRMETGGYVRTPSDHLCVWMDIKVTNLFEQVRQTVPAQIRRLQCGDPRTVKRYNDLLWQNIKKHNVHEEYKLIVEESQLRQLRQKKSGNNSTRNC